MDQLIAEAADERGTPKSRNRMFTKMLCFRECQIVPRVFAVARGRIGGPYAFSMVLAAAAAAFCFESSPAAAQGYFTRFDDDLIRNEPSRDWTARPRSRAEPIAHGRRRAKADGARAARDAKRATPPSPERPLFMVVSIADQRVSVYNRHGLVERSAISTGVAGHPTPKGVFTIIGRERYHHSNIYAGAPMPFMQRVTWSGIAMHLGVVPGHPASHGCIRLPAAFAARLWGLTRIGERVVISPHDVAPAEFSHPLLPSPKMLETAKAEPAPVGAAEGADIAVRPPPINPHRYAEQLKAAATAEAAAAVKNAKEAAAAVVVKRQEAVRAATELRAAEFAHASARAKAEAAAKAYEAKAAAAEQQEQVRVAELAASGGEAEAGRRSQAHAEAVAARDAAATAKAGADAGLAEAATRLEAARTASTAKANELTDALERSREAAAASASAAKAEKEAQLRLAPVSVLVSKKDQRIYVRQGLTPIFDAPARVRDPEAPLGSHLYIATGAGSDGASLAWSVLSLPARVSEARNERGRRTGLIEERTAAAPKAWFPSGPAEALERVDIPQDVRDLIAERLWTGASIIISDQPLSGETGAVGTDLTVKLR